MFVQQLLAVGTLLEDVVGLELGRLVGDALARLVVVELQSEVDRGYAGQIDQAGHTGGACRADQQRLVGGGDITGAEDRARVGVGVDVRHAVCVALDAGRYVAGARRGAGDRVARDQLRISSASSAALCNSRCRRGSG